MVEWSGNIGIGSRLAIDRREGKLPRVQWAAAAVLVVLLDVFRESSQVAHALSHAIRSSGVRSVIVASHASGLPLKPVSQ